MTYKHARRSFPSPLQWNALCVCGAAATALLCSPAAHADSYNWTDLNVSGDWDAVTPLGVYGNWYDNTTGLFSSVVPGSADDVAFGGALYGPLGVNMNGPHAVNSITFDTPQNFTINNSGGLSTALTLTSGSLTQTANDTGTQTISVPITMGTNANWALNGTGTILVSQPVSSNNSVFGLTTTGVGNLTLQGQNTYRGNTTIAGSGTVLLTGSIGVAIGGASPPILKVDSSQGANFVLASSATNSAALITTTTAVGNTQSGTFTQNGGTHITSALKVGYAPNGNGTYNLVNGALTITTLGTLVGGEGTGAKSTGTTTGVFNQSGGLHQTRQVEVGASVYGSGTYNFSGGTLSVGQATFIGEVAGSVGLFNQTGGQNSTQALVLGVSIQYTADPIIQGGWNRVKNVSDVNLIPNAVVASANPAALQTNAQTNAQSNAQTNAQSSVTAKYVLSGGTLTTEAVEGLSTGTEFDFNGGTLQPTTNLTTFISGLDSAVVQSGGAVIDTNGYNVTIPQALVHDASLGATQDGGLTKNGSGYLTLSGSVTYTGPTVVNGGLLVVPASDVALISTHFTSNVGGTLNLNGGTLVSGGTIVDNGVVNVGEFLSQGTITIAGGSNGGTFYEGNSNLILDTPSYTYVGSAATPGGNLTMQNGARVYLAGTLVNNGTITGIVDVNGGSLSGSGRADTINVNAEGFLHPGNGLGTIHAGTATLGNSSVFQFDIDSANGTAGTNWSLLAVDGGLTVGNGFGKAVNILKLASVSGTDDTASPLSDFNPNQPYTWQFVSFGNYTTNGNPFQIDTSAFENATNGGTFVVAFTDGSLNLEFIPAPEPTSISLLGLASFTALRRRRARRAI